MVIIRHQTVQSSQVEVVLNVVFKLKKMKIFIGKESESEFNFLDYLSADLKQKIKNLQAKATKLSEPYLNLTLEQAYMQFIASVQKFKQNDQVESTFAKRLLDSVNLVNTALAAKFSLTVVPTGEAEYFNLVKPFDLTQLEKKQLMFRIIDMINSGILVERMEPTNSSPIINIEDLVAVCAEFKIATN